jgi:DNA-binding XRE family transcriptional regulator
VIAIESNKYNPRWTWRLLVRLFGVAIEEIFFMKRREKLVQRIKFSKPYVYGSDRDQYRFTFFGDLHDHWI